MKTLQDHGGASRVGREADLWNRRAMRGAALLNTRITSRWLFLLALVAAQFVCLKAGEIWFSGEIAARLREQSWAGALQECAKLGVELAARLSDADRLMRADGPCDFESGRIAEHSQAVLDDLMMEDESWVAVLDGGGQRPLALSTQARARAGLDLALLQGFRNETGDCHVADAADAPSGALTGWLKIAGESQLIAAQHVAELDAIVVVGQSATSARGSELVTAELIHRTALNVGWFVIAMGGLLAAAIVLRYENKLAGINQDLRSVIKRRSRSLLKARDAVIFGLAKLAESRDDDTGEHLERIREYVAILARELARCNPEVDEEYIQRLEVTSSLHDIGKVGIPDAVLLKPGRLTPAEHDVIKKHTVIGGDCLLSIRDRMDDDGFLETACEIALAHHERWDGRGYPFGVKGAEIPLSARIVALADVYDALTTPRVYKPAMSHDAARDIIVQGSGAHFDPAVVEAFLRRQAEFQQSARRHSQKTGQRKAPREAVAAALS